MKLYLDSADIEIIEEMASWGVLSGVTTNPSLIAKAGLDFKETVIKICESVKGPVSAEVTVEEQEAMIEQGREFANWHENVVVKLPTTRAGLIACKELAHSGIPVNMTLCFSINQALLCARAGAKYVSPFIGRLDDINEDGVDVLRRLVSVFKLHDIRTEIIAASIRNTAHVTAAAQAGAHIATLPPHVLEQMLSHPLTDSGLAKFMSDWRLSQK